MHMGGTLPISAIVFTPKSVRNKNSQTNDRQVLPFRGQFRYQLTDTTPSGAAVADVGTNFTSTRTVLQASRTSFQISFK